MKRTYNLSIDIDLDDIINYCELTKTDFRTDMVNTYISDYLADSTHLDDMIGELVCSIADDIEPLV